MSKIIKVSAREILDSRGNPTIETEVMLESGAWGVASVPSGASTGMSEALELRDEDPKRYGGKGVLKAISNVNDIIQKEVVGMDGFDQEGLDRKMIELDGTSNKSKLGANAILSVSLAVCRAAAQEKRLPLHEYISKTFGFQNVRRHVIPMFNIINGGKHSDSGLSVQEFKIIPNGIETYAEQLRAGSEIFHALSKLLEKDDLRTLVGDEGGFAPRVSSHRQALEYIKKAIEQSGYELGRQVNIGLDAATGSFYDEKTGKYRLDPEGAVLSREDLVQMYREWIEEFSVISIEDGLFEEDWDGWKMMHEKLSDIMLIGDDLLVTDARRLKKAIEYNACNSVLIKVNQIGSLSETIDCIKLAKENNIKVVISHRSGETTDDFIADLAIGTDADFIKTGSLTRGERICKYNRLLKLQ